VDLDSKEYLAVETRVRQTASVENTALSGGKQETARRYLTAAMKNLWEIQIFDLFDGQVLSSYTIEGNAGDHQRDLFWLSLNIILRWAEQAGKIRYSGPKWKNFVLTKELFDAAVVHIGEQGKERNLVKCSAILSWFYGPGSRVLAKYLAKHETHHTGLTGASDAWQLDKRISPFSGESSFIYNSGSDRLLTRPDIVGFELDLTESTDFLQRNRGLIQLAALMKYSGFPKWYGTLFRMVYNENQSVREVITADEGFKIQRDPYVGVISEGAMMGLEPTKVLLHLAHLRAGETARRVLALRGHKQRISQTEPALTPDRTNYSVGPQYS
jgi:hypothetical protein